MKVSDLSGHLLDDWVARSHGWTKYLDTKNIWWWREKVVDDDVGVLQTPCDSYQPSADWNSGGALLDAAGIFVFKEEIRHDNGAYVSRYTSGRSISREGVSREGRGQMGGSTYLEAGMRTYVFLWFGWDVEDQPNWADYPKYPGDPGYLVKLQ